MPVNSTKSAAHAPPLSLAVAPQPRPSMTVDFKGLGATSNERVSVGFWGKQSAYYVAENSPAHQLLKELASEARDPEESIWVKVELEGIRSPCTTNIVSVSKASKPPSIDEAFLALVAEHYPSTVAEHYPST